MKAHEGFAICLAKGRRSVVGISFLQYPIPLIITIHLVLPIASCSRPYFNQFYITRDRGFPSFLPIIEVTSFCRVALSQIRSRVERPITMRNSKPRDSRDWEYDKLISVAVGDFNLSLILFSLRFLEKINLTASLTTTSL